MYTLPPIGPYPRHDTTRHATLTPLQAIHKLGILPIGQIQKLLIRELPIARLGAHATLGAIHVAGVGVDGDEVEQAKGPAGDDDDLGGDVAGGVFGEEGLRADDVAGAVGNQIESGDGGFLGVAGDVGGDEGEEGDEGGGGRLGEVVAGETPPFVGEGQGDDEDDAHEGEHQAEAGEEDAVAVVVRHHAPGDDGDDFDGPARHAPQQRGLLGVAEGDDELAEEVADPAVGDVGHEAVAEEEPRHGVCERLAELVHFPVAVPHALLVLPDPLHRQHALPARGQEARVELVVRHEPQEDEAHGGRQQPAHEEDDLPGLERRAVFARPDRDAVGDEAAEDLRPPVKREPDARAEALLAFSVPLRRDEGEARRDGGLEDTEEEADGDGAGEVVHRGEAGERQTPEDDVDAAVFANGQFLEEEVGGIFPAQVAKVEEGTEPGVFVADEVEVRLHAHDRRVGQRRFVEVVEPVHDAQNRHDGHVDFAQDALVGLLVEREIQAFLVGKRLHGLIGVVGMLENGFGHGGRARYGRRAIVGTLLDVVGRVLFRCDCLLVTVVAEPSAWSPVGRGRVLCLSEYRHLRLRHGGRSTYVQQESERVATCNGCSKNAYAPNAIALTAR